MDRPLRVCQLGKYYPPARGGMENHVQLLARGQAAHGLDVTVVCVNHRDRSGRDATWSPLSETRTIEQSDGPVRLIRVGRRASLARCDLCPRLPRLLRRLGRTVDLFHLHAPNPAMLLALALSGSNAPLVISHHSDVVRQRLLGLAHGVLERRVYRRARAIFPTSPLYARGSRLLRDLDRPVRPLPLGIDLQPFLDPSRPVLARAADWRARLGSPLWLCVGRLVYYKGLDIAIRALAQVPGQLLIVGEGPLERALRNLADEIGVADRIVWCGLLDDTALAGAYRAATALWFPSVARSEGFGLVQVEAMASGCPVINSPVPNSGVAWVCRHECEGLTAPLNDPAALAGAARRLLAEDGLRERLARAGRARAVSEFDAELMCRRVLHEYEQALDARGQLAGWT